MLQKLNNWINHPKSVLMYLHLLHITAILVASLMLVGGWYTLGTFFDSMIMSSSDPITFGMFFSILVMGIISTVPSAFTFMFIKEMVTSLYTEVLDTLHAHVKDQVKKIDRYKK